MHMEYLVDMICTFLLAAILLKILKWLLLSLLLNLGAQYCILVIDSIWSYPIAKELLILVYIEKKL